MQNGIGPLRVLLFLLIVFILLALISLFFPSGGIRISGSVRLYFPPVSEILQPADPEYADISHLAKALEDVPHSADDGGDSEDEIITAVADSIICGDEIDTTTVRIRPADEGSLRQLVFPVEYPPDNDTALHSFYRALSGIERSGGRLRIIHYGDSQIENDRISSSLRNRLQVRFGGSGTGMFPVISPVPHNASVRVAAEGNWTRRTVAGSGERGPDSRYGLLMSWSALTTDGNVETTGSFTLTPTTLGYSRMRRMEELSVHFGYNTGPFTMELISSGSTIDAELWFPSDTIHYHTWSLPDPGASYRIRITGPGPPRIFSLSLDAAEGVALDNVPIRGSSGLEFSATDQDVFSEMLKEVNARLLILQFGVNVVPHITDDYSYYENALYRQLRVLKGAGPDISVIVVGVSDMSRRHAGGRYESYPNIALIRDAQRNAAHRAGYAFWDLYEVMGGYNSMPSWVASEPSLAQPDYIHFTFRGAELVGNLLYNSIISGYDDYLEIESEIN